MRTRRPQTASADAPLTGASDPARLQNGVCGERYPEGRPSISNAGVAEYRVALVKRIMQVASPVAGSTFAHVVALAPLPLCGVQAPPPEPGVGVPLHKVQGSVQQAETPR